MTNPQVPEFLKVSSVIMTSRRSATVMSFHWLIMRIAMFDSFLFHMKNVLATAQGFLGCSVTSN
jgi:hypothetical protein